MRHWILGLLAFGLVGTAQAGNVNNISAQEFANHLYIADLGDCMGFFGISQGCIWDWYVEHDDDLSRAINDIVRRMAECPSGDWYCTEYNRTVLMELRSMVALNDGWCRAYAPNYC